ncbi:hydrogenase accessory protein HypB [Desulfurobacterium thermolithotrophum DSM 11699]|uniref:Hydrogenase accessory protein HypB n=1 Tax=Desulfurobacterium thermolithotrophum (strain DSM 11699 / BSA) TaxID=868864 RepID=F0S2P2_DESTD|nr:hydrogenase nickel incorporation protein HypB [Desulfurobacterium thermolithotrophum]ADY73114.1 hydrogenase accessory protein HypB [Desulfurobacterium thermolithotrophum DSM 11699]
MCDVCGCGSHDHSHEVSTMKVSDDTGKKTIEVKQSLLQENERIAEINRQHFDEKGILAINLISSPGSGKTTLLEKTIEALKDEFNIGVLEGDIETERDAERVRAKGAAAIQLTTGGACHLEAPLVHKGFHALEKQMNGEVPDILFIENVGNLVCPSSFYLGEHVRVVLVSVPEGPDKPAKYPKAFKTSNVFIITKADLLPYFDFDVEKVKKEALSLNPNLKIFVISSKTGEGLNEWFDYLRDMVEKKKGIKV